MNPKQTRNKAYYSIVNKLSHKRRRIYYLLKFHGAKTSQEIAEQLNKPINEVTGRIRELIELGVIKCIGTKQNAVTGLKNSLYEIVTEKDFVYKEKKSKLDRQAEAVWNLIPQEFMFMTRKEVKELLKNA